MNCAKWTGKLDGTKVRGIRLWHHAVAEIGCGLSDSMIMNGEYHRRIFSGCDHALNLPYLLDQDDFVSWIGSCQDVSIAGKTVHFLDGRIR